MVRKVVLTIEKNMESLKIRKFKNFKKDSFRIMK
jgi:hypothetical protein